jgi:hypothetical protein
MKPVQRYKSIKSFILETISKSKILRKKLSLSEHLKLYKWATQLNEDQLCDYLFESNHIPNYTVQKILDVGLAAAVIAPIPGSEWLFLAVRYLEENFSKQCLKKCESRKHEKQICYWSCHLDSIIKVRTIIEQEYNKCRYEPLEKSKNKCFKKLGYLLGRWKDRELKIKNKVDIMQRMKVINRLRR